MVHRTLVAFVNIIILLYTFSLHNAIRGITYLLELKIIKYHESNKFNWSSYTYEGPQTSFGIRDSGYEAKKGRDSGLKVFAGCGITGLSENLCRNDGMKNSCYIFCFSFFRWSFCVVCALVYNTLHRRTRQKGFKMVAKAIQTVKRQTERYKGSHF